MTRIPLDDLTSDQYDGLCADLARYEEVLAELNDTLVARAKQLGKAEAALARVRKACASVQATGKGFTPTKPYDKGAAKAVDWVVMRVLEAIDARLVNGTTPTPAAPVPCPACARAGQAGLAPTEQHPDCRTQEQH